MEICARSIILDIFYLMQPWQPHIRKCQNSNSFFSKKGTKTTMCFNIRGPKCHKEFKTYKLEFGHPVLTSNSKSVLGLSLTVLVLCLLAICTSIGKDSMNSGHTEVKSAHHV